MSGRKVFCQITQHLLENHEMWKRVLAAEAQEEAQKEEQNCIGSGTDPITAIHEEEEEQVSKEEEEEEEESPDGIDERDMVTAIEEEEEMPLQSETSEEIEEEEPE